MSEDTVPGASGAEGSAHGGGGEAAPSSEVNDGAEGSDGSARHHLPPTRGADRIVRKWTLWSAGFGLIPIPLVDMLTTTGFSVKMLHSLAEYYGVEFRAELGKSAITSLIGGASAPLLAMSASSAVKGIPFLGIPLAMATGPIFAGGLTYAVGRVFTAHFGSGGTLFDFDPEQFRDYFQDQVEEGKALLKKRRKSKGKAAGQADAQASAEGSATATPL